MEMRDGGEEHRHDGDEFGLRDRLWLADGSGQLSLLSAGGVSSAMTLAPEVGRLRARDDVLLRDQEGRHGVHPLGAGVGVAGGDVVGIGVASAEGARWRRGPSRPRPRCRRGCQGRRCRGLPPSRRASGGSTTSGCTPFDPGPVDQAMGVQRVRHALGHVGVDGQARRRGPLRAGGRGSRRPWRRRRTSPQDRRAWARLRAACRGSAGTGATGSANGWSRVILPARGQGWPCRCSTRGRPGRKRYQGGSWHGSGLW